MHALVDKMHAKYFALNIDILKLIEELDEEFVSFLYIYKSWRILADEPNTSNRLEKVREIRIRQKAL